VACLVIDHLANDDAGRYISGWQALQMTLKVLLDLVLGLDDKAQAHWVTRSAGDKADAERARVPNWIQKAGMRIQCLQPLLSPGQVIGLLACCVFESLSQGRISGTQGLRRVEGLGANFSDVIDSHQCA
jgi:hypothetical protein